MKNLPHKNLFQIITQFKFIIIFLLLNFSFSCQKNPATGQNEFNLMSEEFFCVDPLCQKRRKTQLVEMNTKKLLANLEENTKIKN